MVQHLVSISQATPFARGRETRGHTQGNKFARVQRILTIVLESRNTKGSLAVTPCRFLRPGFTLSAVYSSSASFSPLIAPAAGFCHKERPLGEVKWTWHQKSRGTWAGPCDHFDTWAGLSSLHACTRAARLAINGERAEARSQAWTA